MAVNATFTPYVATTTNATTITITTPSYTGWVEDDKLLYELLLEQLDPRPAKHHDPPIHPVDRPVEVRELLEF